MTGVESPLTTTGWSPVPLRNEALREAEALARAEAMLASVTRPAEPTPAEVVERTMPNGHAIANAEGAVLDQAIRFVDLAVWAPGSRGPVLLNLRALVDLEDAVLKLRDTLPEKSPLGRRRWA